MATSPWADDERLLAALKDAGQAAAAVPRELVEAGKAVFTWRDPDAELAALVYDSALDGGLASATRGGPRILIFNVADDHTIEVELGPDILVGQLLPPRPGTVERQLAGGETISAPIDDGGGFALRPAPAGTFRLRCVCDDLVLTTAWVTPDPA
ncbi:hypothetical protein [Nonomuraea basaltis]|uniref:hypothetical protein n=1 Tax=Nonomuraea basaltis TaxID=2495887 RepID=UPI00110C5F3F|nr:hypothetical protein [Nonomuraea basaltis]TMR94511.1 hypothetical protein EJK15_33425 [Nonomuraea basaltis]